MPRGSFEVQKTGDEFLTILYPLKNKTFDTLTYFVKYLLNHIRPNEAIFVENVAELLLIPCICMNDTETESRCHLCLIS